MSANITVQINLEYQKNISQKLIVDVANIARKIGSKGLCSSSIGIVITNNEELKSLHYRYLEENTVTDVLAFPYNEIWKEGKLLNGSTIDTLDNEHNHLGDIIVSFPQAQKQAQMYKHQIEIEIATLIAHGTLHLLGFDHFKQSENILMKEKTLMILKKFNFSNQTL
ncbi:MAG TPA: rRNA maturation RNase YbeY [Dehalococcoidia bacterium]|jgi:probable rRNA maturation factor|nr:rRNA maturation RNase YbeY [Dehalococcoidia bacterium]